MQENVWKQFDPMLNYDGLLKMNNIEEVHIVHLYTVLLDSHNKYNRFLRLPNEW